MVRAKSRREEKGNKRPFVSGITALSIPSVLAERGRAFDDRV
jgi:hypothetical protein